MPEQPPVPPAADYPSPTGPGSGYAAAGGVYPWPAPGYLAMVPRQAYTSWIKRVGAFIIDNLPILIVCGIGQAIAVAVADIHCTGDIYGDGMSCTSAATSLSLIVEFVTGVLVLICAIWNWGYLQGTTGSSIGKAVLKFKVVSDKTGQPIGFGRSLVRQIAHVADAVICYIGYLFPLWDAKRQTLADKIMTTVCLPTS